MKKVKPTGKRYSDEFKQKMVKALHIDGADKRTLSKKYNVTIAALTKWENDSGIIDKQKRDNFIDILRAFKPKNVNN